MGVLDNAALYEYATLLNATADQADAIIGAAQNDGLDPEVATLMAESAQLRAEATTWTDYANARGDDG